MIAVGQGGAAVTGGELPSAACRHEWTNNTFTDTADLLIDITGVTGAIATSNFV